MKKFILYILVAGWFGLLSAEAQTNVGPQKGTVTVSLLVGSASSYSNGQWLQVPDANQTLYSVYSPSLNNYPTNGSLVNMAGIEGKWFFSNTWAARLSTAALLSASPSYEGVPGVMAENPAAGIPNYSQVPGTQEAEVVINAGVAKYYKTKNDHLFWYFSPVGHFQYARKKAFNVTDYDLTIDPGTDRYAEGIGFGASANFGIDYFTNSGITFGFEIQGASYIYTMNNLLPAEGLKLLSADNHNISFFSQPMVKIGFKF